MFLVVFLPGRISTMFFNEAKDMDIRVSLSEYQYFEFKLFPFAKYDVLVSLDDISYDEAENIFSEFDEIKHVYMSYIYYDSQRQRTTGRFPSDNLFQKGSEVFGETHKRLFAESDEKIAVVTGIRMRASGRELTELLENNSVQLINIFLFDSFVNPVNNTI